MADQPETPPIGSVVLWDYVAPDSLVRLMKGRSVGSSWGDSSVANSPTSACSFQMGSGKTQRIGRGMGIPYRSREKSREWGYPWTNSEEFGRDEETLDHLITVVTRHASRLASG